eukprot:Blabericola_migrator_1__8981@NODE_4779_length_982_cov_252_691803_g2979_i0_p1_GENE_NODE_4779_length_982_cov_252_691803_g2979_i0NODE_4779_length_982_cov_252_691803_g2979_i0_p1_ORF_typecomplete_len154_score27_00COG5/PF10392_9/0_12_NODE_4779_length_982_cov_252_691803_g2979_i041502
MSEQVFAETSENVNPDIVSTPPQSKLGDSTEPCTPPTSASQPESPHRREPSIEPSLVGNAVASLVATRDYVLDTNLGKAATTYGSELLQRLSTLVSRSEVWATLQSHLKTATSKATEMKNKVLESPLIIRVRELIVSSLRSVMSPRPTPTPSS